MSIIVTGATGRFGLLAVEALLKRGVPAGEIIATGRNQANLAALRDNHGVRVRLADYEDRESLTEAFAGGTRVLLVSSSEVGRRRVAQHRNAIDAAAAAGVELLAYTSVPRVDTTRLLLAEEHIGTERYLRASGVPHVLLRNGWYMEKYTGMVDHAMETGVLTGAAGDGRVTPATRADLAEAAAIAIGGAVEQSRVYELGGDESFTMTEFAELLTTLTGKAIVYADMPVERFAGELTGKGVPAPMARILADSEAAAARGELVVETGDLGRLLGRTPTTLKEALHDVLGRDPGHALRRRTS